MTFLYFILSLGLLIFIHELGHFLIAKRAGVLVEKFSLGFGPRLIGFRYGETFYQISALPLGGYVKLMGEDPESEEAKHPRAFTGQKLPKRFQIVFAGPAMNLVLALVIMPLVFMLGRQVPAYLEKSPVVTGVVPESPAAHMGLEAGDQIVMIDGDPMEDWSEVLETVMIRPDEEVTLQWSRAGELREARVRLLAKGKSRSGYLGVEPPYVIGDDPIIDAVQEGSPAAQAGLQAGDRVLALNDEAIDSWSLMSSRIQSQGEAPLRLRVQRGETSLTVVAQAEWDSSLERYLLGVRKDPLQASQEMIYKRYSFFEAVKEGTLENVRLAGLTFSVLGRLVTFQLSYKSLGGPIRIAQASVAAAETGFSNFLFFIAFLSLQLGVLNLLPIPVLDGGHLLFMGLEAIRRRPVSARAQGMATQVGLFVLLFLMVIVTVNDIDVVWDFGQMLEKAKSFFQ